MRPASVVAGVLAQHSLPMALTEDGNMVEAVAAKGPNNALADRVGLWRPGRRPKAAHSKP